jgi:hypothetical protein
MACISARTGKPIADGGVAGANDKSVFQAAERTAEFFDHLRAHYRTTQRKPVEIPVSVKVILADGSVYDSGTAVIRNFSPSGALLREIKLPKESYPARAFSLELILRGGEHEGIGIEAMPVRFEPDGSGLGIRFESIFVAT